MTQKGVVVLASTVSHWPMRGARSGQGVSWAVVQRRTNDFKFNNIIRVVEYVGRGPRRLIRVVELRFIEFVFSS